MTELFKSGIDSGIKRVSKRRVPEMGLNWKWIRIELNLNVGWVHGFGLFSYRNINLVTIDYIK